MKKIFFIIVLLIVNGCGMMGNNSKSSSSSIAQNGASNDNNSTQNDHSNGSNIKIAKNILPKNISIDFPTILKDDENNSTKDEIQDKNQSSTIGYSQLKKYISQIDDIVKRAQINLVLLKKVMPQVLEKCEGMSSCTFEPEYLSIVLDNETISEIDKIIDDKNFTQIDKNLNKKVHLGELNFTKEYIPNRDGYRYELKLDLTSNDKVIKELYKDKNQTIQNTKNKEQNITKEEYQIFKWFDYIQDVTTIYFYRDLNKTINVRIYYSVDEDGKESMHVLNSSETQNAKNNMNLTLANKDENNETLKISANGIEEKVLEDNKTVINSFSSNGEISEDSSLILFSGQITDSNETNESQVISEVICNSSECIENNLTKPSEDINRSDLNSSNNYDNNESNNIDIDELNSSVENLRENLKFYQLKIWDTNLSDGSFLILPPYTEIENLKLIDIFKMTIGTFTILDGKAQGEIHSSEYNDMLDELTIVRIEDNPTGDEPLFTVVENKPKIEIIDPLIENINNPTKNEELNIDNNQIDNNFIRTENGVERNITQRPRFYLQPQYLEYLEQSL